MADVETLLTIALYMYWTWRIFSTVYSTYKVSDLVTPSTAGAGLRALVMLGLTGASTAMHLVPRKEYPLVSLANGLLSIPYQAYSIYFAHKYIGDTLDSRRVNIFLYFVTFLIILETLYMLSVDLSRIE